MPSFDLFSTLHDSLIHGKFATCHRPIGFISCDLRQAGQRGASRRHARVKVWEDNKRLDTLYLNDYITYIHR